MHLRMLTLYNSAAGLGEVGAVGDLLPRLPVGRSPGADAYRLAAQLHARTQDDFFPAARIHVGAIALAAALALPEHTGVSLLDCLAAGYRAIGLAASPYANAAQQRGFRPSGMFGPLAAAGSAARALSLDADATASALGLATVASAGTNQSWLSGTDEWLLEVGTAARAGVEAALLVVRGATSSPEAFEGAAGWAAAYFDDAEASRLRAIVDADPISSPVLEVACKLFPVSGIAQVPAELARRARERLGDEPPDRVTVELSPSELAYPGSRNGGDLRSRSSALMSIAFCVAAVLRDGAISLTTLEQPDSSGLSELMGRVQLVAQDTLAEGQARVTVIGRGGADLTLEASVTELLHPSWREARERLDPLAARCEASAADLLRVRDVLSMTAPDAMQLREALERTPATIGFEG